MNFEKPIILGDEETGMELVLTEQEKKERKEIIFNNVIENNLQPDAKVIKRKMIQLLDRIDLAVSTYASNVSLAKELLNITKEASTESLHKARLLDDTVKDPYAVSEGLYGRAMGSLKDLAEYTIRCEGDASKLRDRGYEIQTAFHDDGLSFKDMLKNLVEDYLQNILGVDRVSNIDAGQSDFDENYMEALGVEDTLDSNLDNKVAEVYNDSFQYSPELVEYYNNNFTPNNKARIEGIGSDNDVPQIVRPARVKVYKLKE